MQQYPYDIPTEAFPFEIFKQAFAAIQSCVVHLQVKLPSYLVYICTASKLCARSSELFSTLPVSSVNLGLF